jgi:hypothetical protein
LGDAFEAKWDSNDIPGEFTINWRNQEEVYSTQMYTFKRIEGEIAIFVFAYDL